MIAGDALSACVGGCYCLVTAFQGDLADNHTGVRSDEDSDEQMRRAEDTQGTWALDLQLPEFSRVVKLQSVH